MIDLKPIPKELELPDGRKVFVRPLSGKGRKQYREYCEHAKENGGITAEAVAAMGLCDAEGKLVYDFNNPQDMETLSEFDGAILDEIGIKLFEVSGLTKKAEEDAEKN